MNAVIFASPRHAYPTNFWRVAYLLIFDFLRSTLHHRPATNFSQHLFLADVYTKCHLYRFTYPVPH